MSYEEKKHGQSYKTNTNGTSLPISPFELLGNAVIKQAVMDYALCLCEDHGRDIEKKGHYYFKSGGVIISVTELELFFNSEEYQIYTNVSPEFLMKKTKKLVAEAEYDFDRFKDLLRPVNVAAVLCSSMEMAERVIHDAKKRFHNIKDDTQAKLFISRTGHNVKSISVKGPSDNFKKSLFTVRLYIKSPGTRKIEGIDVFNLDKKIKETKKVVESYDKATKFVCAKLVAGLEKGADD